MNRARPSESSTAPASGPTPASTAAPPTPRDEDLDFFGITHPGLVRPENQDNYLVCTLHKTARVRATSLPHPELFEMPSQRIASFGMVADGVGGTRGGEEASRAAVEAIAEYVTHTMRSYYAADTSDEHAFLVALQEAAERSHAHVLRRASESGTNEGATTLTLYIAVWPTLYLLQIGDSRAYRFREGRLEQLTRDQTVAQELVDSGLLPRERAERSPLSHVLVSALGGPETRPLVSSTKMQLGDIHLLCTDGLTKHVSDERIAERLANIETSEQTARALVDDALRAGGTDNVTVLVLRDIVGARATGRTR